MSTTANKRSIAEKYPPIILTDHVYEEGDIKIVTESNGDVLYYKKGKLHRDGDLPAVIRKGEYRWYRNGKLCRDDPCPSVIMLDDEHDGYLLEWFKKGKFIESKYDISCINGVLKYWRNDSEHVTNINEY
jgi:hypothetical protein